MFWHVYAHAKRASVLRNIVLATDDERIAEAALEWEIPCVMTRRDHASGTDRVFEAASKLGVEPHAVIVNIQGDEPALDPAVIEQLVRPFLDGTVQVSTLATPISPERAASPNQVKVVTAANGDALYFSRSRIPFDREGGDGEILGHIGLYAFLHGGAGTVRQPAAVSAGKAGKTGAAALFGKRRPDPRGPRGRLRSPRRGHAGRSGNHPRTARGAHLQKLRPLNGRMRDFDKCNGGTAATLQHNGDGMKALLALEDGFVLEGRSFTGPCEGGGEVIFNTGMTGYQEILTDPSYYGQMVCMTWPLIGNYGINAEDMESGKVHAAALIVKECCKTPSNWRSVCSLPDFLQQHGVPGIEGIDTRALTRHLRMHGAMRGMVSTSITDPAELVMQAKSLPSMEGQNLVTRVMPATPWKWTGNGGVPAELNADGSYNWPGEGPRLVAYDFGIKWNILRLLTEQGFDVLVVPPSFTAEQVKASGAQAVFLSNGPGDPATLTDEIVTIKKLVESYPVAGICLGHQLLGHALGGTTRKLKFGHHGCNHPVKDLSTGHVEISSQNHGFCVDIDNVSDVVVTHVNLNDGTLEGFAHKTKPILAVQHHPEACPGPIDSQYFFARFRGMVRDAVGF